MALLRAAHARRRRRGRLGRRHRHASTCNRVATEIQAGSYALMDTAYAKLGLPFRCALSVLATRDLGRPRYAVADCGLKALGMDHGNPAIDGAQGLVLLRRARDLRARARRVRVGERDPRLAGPRRSRRSPTTSGCTSSPATRCSRAGRSTCAAGSALQRPARPADERRRSCRSRRARRSSGASPST